MKKLLALGLTLAVGLLVGTKPVQAADTVWAHSGQQSGSAQLGWVYRGGSCQVRYTESDQTVYKYQTVASCDQAGLTVGYLTPGRLV